MYHMDVKEDVDLCDMAKEDCRGRCRPLWHSKFIEGLLS